MYIDKAFDKSTGLKKIVTFGIDYHLDETNNVQDQAYVLKIWNVESLISEAYQFQSLTGGTIWSKGYQEIISVNNARGDDEMQPFQVPILVNNKPYKE